MEERGEKGGRRWGEGVGQRGCVWVGPYVIYLRQYYVDSPASLFLTPPLPSPPLPLPLYPIIPYILLFYFYGKSY